MSEEFEVVDMGDAGVETRQYGPGSQPDYVYWPQGGRVQGLSLHQMGGKI